MVTVRNLSGCQGQNKREIDKSSGICNTFCAAKGLTIFFLKMWSAFKGNNLGSKGSKDKNTG